MDSRGLSSFLFHQKILLILLVTTSSLLQNIFEVSAQVLDPNNPLATTGFGRIRGSVQDIGDGKTILSFIGIPFAAPPTRGNRFREPQLMMRFPGDLDATNHPSNRVSCPQVQQRFVQPNLMIPEDEDCLYLNVFVPAHRSGMQQRFPVVVYFHGGEFKFGGKDYYKPDILLRQDVILVVPNYRLGILGFFSTNDDNAPGNYGIRDQIAALRWVNNEIHSFGGDPRAITIFGHDAGAISVNILMLTPESKGLFNRSIAVSGSVFTPWAFMEEPYHYARQVASVFKCKLSSKDMSRCLREKNLGELMSASNTNRIWFRPTIDFNVSRPLLSDFPHKIYETRDVNPVPFLAGLMRHEGSLDYYLRYKDIDTYIPPSNYHNPGAYASEANTRKAIGQLIRPFLKKYANENVLASSIHYYYFRRFNNSQSRNFMYGRQLSQPALNINYNQKFIEMMGDFLYNAPMDKALKAHSRSGGNSFLYVFSHQGPKAFGVLQADAPRELTRDSYGVTHFDDTFYIVPSEYNNLELDATGKLVSGVMTRCLVNFIGFIPNNMPGCIFKPYTEAEGNYLNFGPWTQPQALRDFRPQDDIRFWNDLIYEVIEYTATPPPYFPYSEYEGFRAATWSLLAFLLLMIVIIVVLAVMICISRNEDKRSLKLLRSREREFEERYNEQP